MKTSITRIQEFINAQKVYLQKSKNETKLHYAIKKVLPRLQKCFDQYHEQKEDIELEHVNTDQHGSILYKVENGVKVFDFTPAAYKKVREKKKALLTGDNFEFEPYFAPEVPEDFPSELTEFFQGFVLQPSQQTIVEE